MSNKRKDIIESIMQLIGILIAVFGALAIFIGINIFAPPIFIVNFLHQFPILDNSLLLVVLGVIIIIIGKDLFSRFS